MALSINLGFMVTAVFLTSWGSSSASTALQDPKVTSSSEAESHSLKKITSKSTAMACASSSVSFLPA